jgi:hypothetical protein
LVIAHGRAISTVSIASLTGLHEDDVTDLVPHVDGSSDGRWAWAKETQSDDQDERGQQDQRRPRIRNARLRLVAVARSSARTVSFPSLSALSGTSEHTEHASPFLLAFTIHTTR